MNDLDAAMLCQAAYIGKDAGWFHWIDVAGVVAGIQRSDGDTIVAFRGSSSQEDWLRDLDELPVDTKLGHVHRGFIEGMDTFMDTVFPLLRGRVFLTGHSLGAAHAAIFAGMLTQRWAIPKRLVLFGCPRPGFQKLSEIVSGAGIDVASYRNRNDPVTEVPYLLGLYKHIVEPAHVESKTSPEPFVLDHLMQYYIEAMASK